MATRRVYQTQPSPLKKQVDLGGALSAKDEKTHLESTSKTDPYNLMRAAIELHERGASPPEYLIDQEKIRAASSLNAGMGGALLANTRTGGHFLDWVVRGKHWMQGTHHLVHHEHKLKFPPIVRAGALMSTSIRIRSHSDSSLPTAVRQKLRLYGSARITGLELVRVPVYGMLIKAHNLITKREWGTSKHGELPYDDIYHLHLKITTEDGKVLYLDKDPRITLSTPSSAHSGRYESTLKLHLKKEVELEVFLAKSARRMGSNFYAYDAYHNTNQMFINGVLLANADMVDYSSEAKEFVSASVEKLITTAADGNELMRHLAVNIVKSGGSFDSGSEKSVENSTHITGVRSDAQQPLSDARAPLHVDVNELHEMTGLMSGGPAHRLKAVDTMSGGALSFIRDVAKHITKNPGSERQHPLVSSDQIKFLAESPDHEVARQRLKVIDRESGHGVLTDLALADNGKGVLHSWVNQNIMHPIFHKILHPMEARFTKRGGGLTAYDTKLMPDGTVHEVEVKAPTKEGMDTLSAALKSEHMPPIYRDTLSHVL